MDRLIIQAALVLFLSLALLHISNGETQAADQVELEKTSEENLATDIGNPNQRNAREAGRKFGKSRKVRRQNKRKSNNGKKKSRKIKKKSAQGKKSHRKMKKNKRNLKKKIIQNKKKARQNSKKSGQQKQNKKDKSRRKAKIGKQSCDTTALRQKLKDFNKIGNQLRQVKRISKFCEVMDKKADKSAEVFEATVVALSSVVARKRYLPKWKQFTRSTDNLTNILDKLKKCSKSAKAKCERSSVEACGDEALNTECEKQLGEWIHKYNSCQNDTATTQDSCSCITSLKDVSDKNCLKFANKMKEVVTSKKKCTSGDVEGSFGHCKKLQVEAAEKGPGAKCNNPGPVVSTTVSPTTVSGLEHVCKMPACITYALEVPSVDPPIATLPQLAYRSISDFSLIWNSKGTVTGQAGSFWQPASVAKYCLLGDVAVNGYTQPSHTVAVLWQSNSVAMVRPSTYSGVWNDKGSGAKLDGAVYRLIAPAGYRCLGGVAKSSYSVRPQLTEYCCLKNEYTVPGKFQLTYNDKWTGATENVALWKVVPGPNGVGVPGNNFFPVNNYDQPNNSDAFLLNN